MTQDIYTNTSAFGLMPVEMQEAMTTHRENGGDVQIYGDFGWLKSKSHLFYRYSVYRAVRPALKPMTAPWDAIKPEYICAAKDKSDEAFCYPVAPEKAGGMWCYDLFEIACQPINHLVGYDPGEVDWEDSLIWRPGHEPKGGAE